MRGNLIAIHIADIHFGVMNPELEYKILEEQFLTPISTLPRIDMISIDGDLFDHKLMASSTTIIYVSKFIELLVQICKNKNATLVIIIGTSSHQDCTQMKLFYHYLEDPTIDIRIVETIKFEVIKNARVLCIPELYNVDESIYDHFFHKSGWYDLALIHGTYNGAVYGNNVGQGRLLTKEDFVLCKGMCISGHVHKPGCFDKFYYYTGCPIPFCFGDQEGPRGYLISNQDLDTGIHYVEFQEITSFRYETIFLDQLVSEDPKVIIDYINNLKANKGIDFIKIKFRCNVSGSNKTIINNYYRNNSNVTIEFNDTISTKTDEQLKESINNSKYNYLTDDKLSDFERFVMFVNDSEGHQFITVDKLTEILNKEI